MKPIKLDQTTILIIHIFVALFILYISWSILTKTQIPRLIGILLIIVATFLIIAQSYFYISRKNSDDMKEARGLSFDDDSDYKVIGGRPGGITWV